MEPAHPGCFLPAARMRRNSKCECEYLRFFKGYPEFEWS